MDTTTPNTLFPEAANQIPNPPLVPTEVIAPSAIESLQRAEVDLQIATAHRYPRQVGRVKQEMLSYATLDQETAEGCFYSLPRGGRNIEGPSVRLAEIAASCYGNIRVASRVISTETTGETPHVIIQAVAHDLEKNVAVAMEKRRRIVGKKSKGGAIDEDDINLATNACAAIAFRDAVFKVVPLALIKPVMDQAKRVAIGDARTLNERRARALDTFAKMGVPKERVIAAVGKSSVDEIGIPELETLIGMHTAIRDGASTVDDLFPSVPLKPKFADSETAPQPVVTPMVKRGPGRPRKETSFPAAQPASPAETPVSRLKSLCAQNKVPEPILVSYLQQLGSAEETLTTLDAIATISPEVIDATLEAWPEIIADPKFDEMVRGTNSQV